MKNWQQKMYQFMYGRYGTYGADALNKFLLVVIGIGFFSNLFFFRNTIVSISIWVLLIFYTFRMYSKNVYKRQSENNTFLNITKPIHKRFALLKKQRQDPSNKYYLCPSCSQLVRVPKGRGKITITCPSCKNKFDRKT